MPLLAGMTVFVLAILALILWLIFSGATGKQRGLVIVNLRATPSVLTFDDGQTRSFPPGDSETLFAIKGDFPQNARITNPDGTLVYAQILDYKTLVDSGFRIGIGDDHIVLAVQPNQD
jgi:hypothetical protein